ncbi:MAG TPA: hypothetical protein VGB73_07750 [Pyrinomonadaceae bacterium]|jgi:hypothetical protein
MSTDDIKRLNYYERQFLGASDFEQEQSYHIEMRRRHTIGHHRAGIVEGLDIRQDSDSKIWSVSPGMAVDGYGREIYVFDAEPLNVESIASQLAGESKPALLKVWLAYKLERTTRPAPGYRACDAEEQFMRVRETFRLIYQDDPPFDLRPTGDQSTENPDNLKAWPRAFDDLPDNPSVARWPVYLGTLTWDADPDNPSQNVVKSVSKTDPRDDKRRRYVAVVAEEIEAPDNGLLIRGRSHESPLPSDSYGMAVWLEGSLEVNRHLTADRDMSVLGNAGIGIGMTEPPVRLQIGGGKDATLDGKSGFLVVGAIGGTNLVFDTNELMARNNGQTSTLHLQAEGGDLVVHQNKDEKTKLVVKDDGKVGIGTLSPNRALTLRGDAGTYLNVRGNNGTHEVLVGADNAGGILSTMTDHDLQLRAGGNSTKLTVKANGRIGVGTGSPNRRVTVHGEDDTYLNVRANDGAQEILIGADGSGGIVSTMTNHDLQLRAGGNNTRLTVKANGDVGIGTTAPTARLHVQGNRAGNAGIADHIALIENVSGSSNADVLALKVGNSDPRESNNYVTFFNGSNQNIGRIEAHPDGNSINFGTVGGDYAEWLQRLDAEEQMEAGDIVGLFAGKISKTTGGAHHLMVISTRPIILGNMPTDETRHLFERVAFLGQVEIKVRGLVRAGDLIVPSGLADGCGMAVAPKDLWRVGGASCVVGRAWQDSNEDGVRKVNALVGLPVNHMEESLLGVLQSQAEELRALRAEVEKLKASR